jgi:hypothetical protein
MTVTEAKEVIAAIINADRGPEEARMTADSLDQSVLDNFIYLARDAVTAFDYEIIRAQDQITKDWIYVLVNTRSDLSTQAATSHSPEELAYIKRLFDAMFDTHNTPRMEVMALNESQALQLARIAPPRQSQGRADREETGGPGTRAATLRGLKHSEALSFLQSLIHEGWLEKSRAGYFSLTTRSLAELQNWLVETYNDTDVNDDEWQRIKTCLSCKDIVTVGQRCSDKDCNARVHDMCSNILSRSSGKQCPKCQKPWDEKHFVGERAVTSTEAYNRRKGSRLPTRGHNSDAHTRQAESDDEVEEDIYNA